MQSLISPILPEHYWSLLIHWISLSIESPRGPKVRLIHNLAAKSSSIVEKDWIGIYFHGHSHFIMMKLILKKNNNPQNFFAWSKNIFFLLELSKTQ